MTINPNSIAHLGERYAQYQQTDVAQTRRDFFTQNGALAEMQKDLEAGNLDSAQAAKDAAVQAQPSLVTDRANQRDLRPDLQAAHNHFRLRHDDLYRMKITQSGNFSGVKQALDDQGKVQTDIHGDWKNMCATNQAPSPIDVTA